MTSGRTHTIIDTDPGLDDAIAILFALRSSAFDILGLTTVAGNIGLPATTRNAGRLLALARRSGIPVISGAAAPLQRPALDVAAHIHGVDGIGGVPLPEPGAPARTGAVEWIAGKLGAAPERSVDLLALGPLTNVAGLISRHPAEARRMRRIIAMGGAVDTHGNVGSRTEFNFAADPEAAQMVLSAGLPLTLVPLDVTRQLRASSAYAAQLNGSARPEAAKAGAMINAYFKGTDGGDSRPLHDPCVTLLAERPDLFAIEQRSLSVVCDGTDSGALAPGDHVIDVAMGVDAPAALALLARTLAD